MSENHQSRAQTFEEMLESSLTTLNIGETVTGIGHYRSQTPSFSRHRRKGYRCDCRRPGYRQPLGKAYRAVSGEDRIDACVLKVNDTDGVATLSKKRADADRNWQAIVLAHENNETLEGKVTGVNKGGVEVNVNSIRVFVPASQTGLPKDKDMSQMLGETVRIRIIEVKSQRKRAIGSIRLVLRDEKRAREAAFWDSLEVGMKFTGKVKSMTSYGAFVDLGVVDGMVHTTELS